jgi:ABC-2 type transport system ATP-binding protein
MFFSGKLDPARCSVLNFSLDKFPSSRREAVIKIENVTKMYGPTVAVKDVSFEVEKGEILGFLGPNGAGKTTTMRVITGYFPPTLGNAYVAGHSVLDAPLEVKRRIGYVPETPAMYNDMFVKEYIRYIGAIKGVPKSELKNRVDEIIETCALQTVLSKSIGSLSKGFKQRVALGQALVNDPPVLVLDEPTSGLDPKQIHEIRSLIKSMEGERTIILSTHILPEVSMTCSKVVIINEGVIVAADTTENIGRSLTESHQVELTVGGDPASVKDAISAVAGIKTVKGSGNRFIVDSEKDNDVRAEIARKVVEGGFDLLEMRSHSMTLEDVFLKLVTEEEGVRQ